jgi:hypothetical protein
MKAEAHQIVIALLFRPFSVAFTRFHLLLMARLLNSREFTLHVHKSRSMTVSVGLELARAITTGFTEAIGFMSQGATSWT